MLINNFSKEQSSLISGITYYFETEELEVRFHKYYTDKLTYLLVNSDMVLAFNASQSLGKFYLTYIKPNFKQKNTNQMTAPKGINKSSDKKRFIKMRINVLEINKDWLFVGEKGTYLDITLMLSPDGEVDKFENLGMVVQDVPQEVYKKDKKAQGPILGNGKELQWEGSSESGVGGGGTLAANADNKVANDLPF
jgi:hypothetical protein